MAQRNLDEDASTDSGATLLLCSQCNNTLLAPAYDFSPRIWNNIRTHANPDTAERSQIAQKILSAECDLAHYRVELARLRGIVSKLEKQEEKVREYISGYRSYLNSAVRRFPTEILLLIFSEVVSSIPDPNFTTTLHISLVCFRWRNIALSAPSLWRNIYVGKGCPPDINKTLVQLYIKRSMNEPLRIAANVMDKAYAYCYAPALSALYASSDRWEEANLKLLQPAVPSLNSNVINKVPMLQTLTLEMYGIDSGERCTAFSHAPQLRTVALTGVWAREVELPWSQLEAVEFGGNYLKHPFDWTIMAGTSASGNPIRIKHFAVPYRILWSTGTLRSIYLTSVHLGISRGTSSISGAILPSLVALKVQIHDPIGDIEWGNSLVYFLRRSKCQLECFELVVSRGSIVEPSELLLVLQATSSLQSLKISEADFFPTPLITNEVLRSLSSVSMLPNLTSLQFVWTREHSGWSDALIALLRSRVSVSNNAKSLKAVTLGIRHGKEMPPDVVVYMKELRAFGVIASLW
ncbi:uncharacterized protein EV420DRAFT_1485597 [Desarmillaria tabescens]|uniref:F-box domain-containing protein n=1 Tax=Armillaria tabescens TaxID=1929756 RepID=A0AA39MP74_ARMTA|nr:uncharacterized protein EV420DRAFT_1485597 [Desarmillaria tabescens]KAK0441527.1 hypothetical protein EV420DRAFT_1485597 [Desarmillaria tabescens]